MLNPSILKWMESTPSAALTWYSQSGRLEFTGPVLARWLAKTANFVAESFDQPHVALDLPASWRTLVWLAGIGFAGGQADLNPGTQYFEYDMLITSDEQVAKAAIASDPGLVVLLQDLGMMALSWGGQLPTGVGDAISEINAQPDVLALFTPEPAVLPKGEANLEPQFETGTEVVVGNPYISRIWQAWNAKRPALWIEQGLNVDAILRQENLA